jgi:hypothetical protein
MDYPLAFGECRQGQLLPFLHHRRRVSRGCSELRPQIQRFCLIWTSALRGRKAGSGGLSLLFLLPLPFPHLHFFPPSIFPLLRYKLLPFSLIVFVLFHEVTTSVILLDLGSANATSLTQLPSFCPAHYRYSVMAGPLHNTDLSTYFCFLPKSPIATA